MCRGRRARWFTPPAGNLRGYDAAVGNGTSIGSCTGRAQSRGKAREKMCRPYATSSFMHVFPALKRWAIIGCPSGAGFRKFGHSDEMRGVGMENAVRMAFADRVTKV